ncbi:MAG: MMPL family transporter [Candidatus Tectimicrobiota bacterium]
MVSKRSAVAWLVIVLGLCSLSAYQTTHHWRIQTDILALLPQAEQEPAVHTIKRMVVGELGRTVLCLVSHAQPHIARHATHQLGTLMQTSQVFTAVRWDYSRQPQAFFALYFPLRYRLISPTIRAYLEREDGYQYLLERLTHELYKPTSSLVTRFLDDDPLLFFPALIKEFEKNFLHLAYVGNHAANTETGDKHVGPMVEVEHGMVGIKHQGRHYYLLVAHLGSNPFAEHTQTQLQAHWQRWSTELRQTFPGLHMTYTAVARSAASMRDSMQSDMLLISIGSTLGIVGFILPIFRSLHHLMVAFVPLILGLWSALGLSLSFFGELHTLTLVFGASLIGVCIDYSFHYFVHHRVARQGEAIATMRRMLPALSLGALTTVLSYVGLGLTPLAGLRQIAVFASCGLLVSFLTVVFWFPFLLRHRPPIAPRAALLPQGLQAFLSLWERHKKLGGILLLGGMALCLQGIVTLQVSDSPLVLKTLPSDVAAEEALIRDITGQSAAQQYLIIDGQTPEEALQRLEHFQDAVPPDHVAYGAELGPLLTTFLPSRQRQADNVRAVKRLLDHAPDVARALEALGLSASSIETFFRDVAREPGPFLLPEQWLQHEASVGLRHWWFDHPASGTSLVVRLEKVTDVAGLQAHLAAFPDIRYFDYVEDLTRIFARYRRQIMLLVSGAYVVILALLLWRYHLRGLLVMLPPVLATGITLGVLGLLGHTLHLLHWLSLLLILGMGVDYAIFWAESDPASELTTFLALTLAAGTTILSFGLLSFSSQEALKAIGFTTFLGIVCGWFLSPLARYGRSGS